MIYEDEEIIESPKEEEAVSAPVEEVAAVESQPAEDKTSEQPKKKKSKARTIIGWTFTIIFAGLFAVFGLGQIDGMIHKKENNNQNLSYGYGAFIIQTDSMEPVYKTKTAIITHKDSAKSAAEAFDAGKVVDITFIANYISNNSRYDYPDYRPGNISYGGIDYKLEGKNPVYPKSGETQIITHRLIGYHLEESRELGKGRYTFVVAGINTEGSYSKEGQYQLLTENELIGIVKMNSQVLGRVFMFITTPWGLLVFLLVPAFYLVITSVLDIFKAIKEPEEGNNSSSSSSSAGDASLEGLSEEDKERLKKEMLEELLNKKGQ